MSDFDFDELDRAVNNAITPDSNDDGLVETLDTTSNTPPTPQSQQDVPPAVSRPSTQPVRTTVPAARRSSGRFMDVVHPSSDMRSGTSGAISNAPASRPQPAAPVTPVQPAASIEELTQEDWQKPLESPFLTDAKVEKRPLGGEAPTTTEFDPMRLLEEPDEPRLEAEYMPDPIDFAAQSQASLVEEVIDEPEVQAEPIVEVEAVTAEAPAAHSEVPIHAQNDSKEAESNNTSSGYGEGSFQPEVKDDAPVGPTSISQQYTEQPSSSPESGAIYDTEAYHQPLAPVVKKKKPSLAILWILLILILGAGAGAAFYFYILPMI